MSLPRRPRAVSNAKASGRRICSFVYAATSVAVSPSVWCAPDTWRGEAVRVRFRIRVRVWGYGLRAKVDPAEELADDDEVNQMVIRCDQMVIGWVVQMVIGWYSDWGLRAKVDAAE